MRKAGTIVPTLAVTLVLSGCGKAVKIKSSYGRPPDIGPIEDLVLLTIHDRRGRNVSTRTRTTTVDLPDTATTTAEAYDDSIVYTTTYASNEMTFATGATLGGAFIEDLDNRIAQFAQHSPSFMGVPIVDVDSLVALDDAHLARVAAAHGARRVAIVQVERYEFETDAGGNSSAWGYVGGLTLGLALPFIPLERWDATIVLDGDVFLWESGRGIVGRQPLELRYTQRGPGIPSYVRVLRGVSLWADTQIAEDVLGAVGRACAVAW